MVEFLRKFENRGIKIARDNSISITKSINLPLFTLILFGIWVRCDRRRFSVLCPLIETSVIKDICYQSLVALHILFSINRGHPYQRNILIIEQTVLIIEQLTWWWQQLTPGDRCPLACPASRCPVRHPGSQKPTSGSPLGQSPPAPRQRCTHLRPLARNWTQMTGGGVNT